MARSCDNMLRVKLTDDEKAVLDLIKYDALTDGQRKILYRVIFRLHGKQIRKAVEKRTTKKQRKEWGEQAKEAQRVAWEKENKQRGRPKNEIIHAIMRDQGCTRAWAYVLLKKNGETWGESIAAKVAGKES